uniref:NADH-ubiquinone oxidoreductase chain 6 n=1 Tax=Amphioplus laevis TaxID=2806440 RepID=A0A888VFN6_9ECHI|nr:NADH dehydrogenase subunit 6 [Amphioplus laevis]QRC36800.1 NADH dehydrogenase subunit 6 [Amphioplus laevis]
MLMLFISSLILGGLVVFSARSPYYGIFGILLQAISFSGLFCIFGFPFFGLLMILIYVGGMLIIFLFSTVLSAERYPESGWLEVVFFWVSFSLLSYPLVDSWGGELNSLSSLGLGNEAGLGEVFSLFGSLTVLVVVVLLVALMVVLAFGFENSEESLRKL